MKIMDLREIKKRGYDEFPMEYYYIEPTDSRYSMTHHWHEELEIIHVLDGTLKLSLDDNGITVYKDDYLFINGGTLHGGITDNCIYEVIVFDFAYFFRGMPAFSKQLAPLFHQEVRFPNQLPAEDISARKMLAQIFKAMQSKEPNYEYRSLGFLILLTGYFLDHKYYEPVENKNAREQRIKSIKVVLDYIEHNYADPISLEELSALAGMSPKYFCRFFKEMTFKTPIDYVNYYRIEVASEKLKDPNTSVTDVAFSCGFNDLNYFIRCFKKYKEISPKQYMLRLQKNHP